MNETLKAILEKILPVILAFIIGLIVAWQGCGDISNPTEVQVIEKPTPTIQYIDRWKTDTVRFVKTKVVTVTDTISRERIVNRLDTLFMVDTVKIVEAFLTEVAKYDTTLDFESATINLKWQNYQNFSEQLKVTLDAKRKPNKWSLGAHGSIGLLSDFKASYVPLFSVGLQATVKKTYFGADYGYNGQHYVGVRVGANFINR
jgi:hypothetical protein